ncbi:MAG TPA: TolC family protein [Armatimonadota bacterium]|nr:TolC family protein [Armatimonadota bacterium]
MSQLRRLRSAWIACALILAAMPGLGQNNGPAVPADGPLTIDTAVEIALANHPLVGIAQRSVDSAGGALTQARSGLLPSLDVRSDYSRSMSSGSAVVNGVPIAGGATKNFSTQYNSSISASQLVYDFGRTSDDIRSSRFRANARSYDLAQTEDDVINNARQAYLVLLTNEELLEVARYRVRLQEETLRIAQGQFVGGLVPEADTAKAESALASAVLDVASAANAVSLAQINLNSALGIDVRTSYDVVAPDEPDTLGLTLDELIDIAMADRPELLATRAQTDAARADLAAARKGQRPSVNASASYGRRDDSLLPQRDYWNLGVSLNANLFDGKFTKGRQVQARANHETSLDTEYQLEQIVALETAQSVVEMDTAREEMGASDVSIRSAQQDLRLANGRYAENVGILLEILDAQAALTSAQADLARARFGYRAAFYALERAIGIEIADAIAPE